MKDKPYPISLNNFAISLRGRLGNKTVNMKVPSALKPFCTVCAKEEGLSKCGGGCQSEPYCSSEHQRQDWPNHKSFGVCSALP